jgi:glycerophosphoryl diester phosphodiesterase
VRRAGFQFDWILPRLDILVPELITRAHDFGRQVVPWTLNTRGELKKTNTMGVAGFVTDDPCNVVNTLKTSGF